MATTSETNINILKALFNARGEMETIATNQVNNFNKSRYADLPQVMRAVEPALRKYQILHQGAVKQNEARSEIEVTLRYTHLDSGEWYQEAMTFLTPTCSPQEIASITTYARRYMLLITLDLAVDDESDDDGVGPEKAVRLIRDPGRQALNAAVQAQTKAQAQAPGKPATNEAPATNRPSQTKAMYDAANVAIATLGEEKVRDIVFAVTGMNTMYDIKPNIITRVTGALLDATREAKAAQATTTASAAG